MPFNYRKSIMQQFAIATVFPRSIAWLIRPNEWARFERIINEPKLLDKRLAQCKGDDEHRKLQQEPIERNGMNVLWEHTGDLTKDGFNPFSHQLFVITAPAIIPSLGVLLPRWCKLNPIKLCHRVFRPIVSVATVHEELAPFRQVQRQHVQPARIRSRAGQESKLYGHACFGRDNLHFDAVKVATLGTHPSSELLASHYSRARDANVVADRHRKRVQQIFVRVAGLLQDLAELMKDGVSQLGKSMQAAGEARFAEHLRHQACLLQKATSRLHIGAEELSGDQSSRQHFRLTHHSARVFGVACGLEQVINNAVQFGCVIDHRSPPTFVWRRSGGDFLLFSKNWQIAN